MRQKILILLPFLALLALASCGGADPSDSGGQVGGPADIGQAPVLETTAGASVEPAGVGLAVPPDEMAGPAGAGGGGAAGASTANGGGQPPTPSPARSPAVTGETAPVGAAANDILERAERTYAQVRSMEADFVQEVFVPLLETTQHSRGKIYHRSPDRFAMRFTDPQGDVIVADGRYLWMYHPSTDARQVLRSTLAQGGQQIDLQREFLSNATQRYSATRAGSEAVGGRPAHALTLVPRGPSPYRQIRIWIDEQDFLARRFEITEENGSVRKLEMSGLRPNVALADAIFQFTPPAGAQVHDF